MSEWRKIILRALLAALALTALAGVAAILLAEQLVTRVMLTGLLTAVAAVLLLRLSSMVDRAKTHAAGIVGISAVVTEFILILSLTWEIHALLPGRWDDVALWVTAGIIVPLAGAAMVFLWMLHVPKARIAGYTGLVLTVACFLSALAGTWLPILWRAQDNMAGTAAAIALFGPLVIASLVGVAPGDRRHWRWLGVGASTVTFAIGISDIWFRTGRNEQITYLLVTIACYVGYANLILLVPLERGHERLRTAVLVCGGATAILTMLFLVGFDLDLIERLGMAAAVLTACGTVALGVLARLNRRPRLDTLPPDIAVTLFCPLCRKKQAIPAGGSACKGCGLRIEVRTEEPTCSQCGYLLYRLTSDNCPECGTPVQRPAAA
jgi:hypothetical protein